MSEAESETKVVDQDWFTCNTSWRLPEGRYAITITHGESGRSISFKTLDPVPFPPAWTVSTF